MRAWLAGSSDLLLSILAAPTQGAEDTLRLSLGLQRQAASIPADNPLTPTLREVMALYNRGGIPNPWLSPEIVPLNLTVEEQEDLLAFVESLTGEVSRDVATPPVLLQ